MFAYGPPGMSALDAEGQRSRRATLGNPRRTMTVNLFLYESQEQANESEDAQVLAEDACHFR